MKKYFTNLHEAADYTTHTEGNKIWKKNSSCSISEIYDPAKLVQNYYRSATFVDYVKLNIVIKPIYMICTRTSWTFRSTGHNASLSNTTIVEDSQTKQYSSVSHYIYC